MAVQLKLIGGNFISSSIRVGDRIELSNAPNDMFVDANQVDFNPNTFTGKFLITSIIDEETLTYDAFLNNQALNISLKTGVTGTVNYSIKRPLTKDEQIDELIAYVNGIKNKQVVAVWPPSGRMEDGTKVDGTFIAASLASAKSALPPQQGMTKYPISGPYELEFSNTYFRLSQLKKLAEAGWCVFVQDKPGTKIYSLHQRTTDTSTFENSEMSCVNTVDKVSLDLKTLFQPYVGPYNINQDYISLLNIIGDEYFYKARTQKAPKCGPLLINGKIDSIRARFNGQNTDLQDGVIEMIASIEIGKPGNWIRIKLLVD